MVQELVFIYMFKKKENSHLIHELLIRAGIISEKSKEVADEKE